MIKQTIVLLLVLVGISTRMASAQGYQLITATEIKLPVIVGGEDKTIDYSIDGDLIGAGGKMRILSDITGDAYIGGGQVDFGGSVDQDLVVAGGEVTIRGRVGKNLIVVGGSVKVEDTAMVGGYVLAAGGQVSLNGQVNGPVRVATSKMVIGEMAYIGGNLEADVEDARVAETAQIEGQKNIKIHQTETRRAPETAKEAMRGLAVVAKVFYFLSKLVTLLVLVTIAGKLMAPAAVQLQKFWPTLGWGMVVVVVAPFVMVVLMTTVIGIPLSLIILAAYLVTMYLSSLVVSAAFGSYLAKQGWLKTKNNYLLATVGLILISAITWIPFMGWFIQMLVCFMGMGIMFKLATEKKIAVAKK